MRADVPGAAERKEGVSLDEAQREFGAARFGVGRSRWLFAGLAAVSMIVPAAAQSQPEAQSAAVRSVIEASDRFARAYGAGAAPRSAVAGAAANPADAASNDLAGLMDEFDERATYAGTLQPFWLRGRPAIQDLWSRYFARYSDRRMIFRDRDVQVFGTASVENGYAEMYMGVSSTTSVPTFLRYSITRALRDGKWVIVSMIVDRLPADQPAPGTMPPWANTPPSAP